MRAEHDGREVLARVLGLHAHGLRPRLDVGEADPRESRRGLVRRGKCHGPRQPASAGSATRRSRPGRRRRCPRPPHCATRRPPGTSAANRCSNRRSWSAIQWNVAVERIASTGGGELELGEVGDAHVGARAEPLARLGDHRRRAVDRDDLAAREPLEQRRRHAPGAAAGVEHALVPAQLEPVEHLAAHRLQRRRDTLVGGGVPVARGQAVTSRSASSAAASTRRATSSAGRRQAPRTCEETISGSVESGDRRRRGRGGSRAAELAPQRLQPVVAGESAAEADADVAERQVDLVVQRRARGRGRRGRSRARGRRRGRSRS